MSLGLIGATWAGPVASALDEAPEARNVSRSSYVVRSGDSVWDIAERLSPGTDPRPLVDAILETNDLDASALTPGQTLVIPTG